MRADEVRVIVVIAAIAALFVGAAWLPIHARANGLRERVERARQETEARAVETQGLARLAERVDDMEQYVSTMTRRVGQQADLSQLLRQLSAELTKRKATDREIITQPQVRYPHYTLSPMTLRFKATFTDTFEVLRLIESMPRMTCVSRLEINTPARGDERGLLEVHLGLASFTQPPQERD
jgi:Tfp pilus assembly protein PilO